VEHLQGEKVKDLPKPSNDELLNVIEEMRYSRGKASNTVMVVL